MSHALIPVWQSISAFPRCLSAQIVEGSTAPVAVSGASAVPARAAMHNAGRAACRRPASSDRAATCASILWIRVLRYEITETFVNRGSRVGEADYMFPLPKGAAFQDLKLEINGEMVAGETMSADRARGIYEEIVRRQRDPALLEWMGYGLLRARIFPIAPGEAEESSSALSNSSAARR